MIAYHGSKTTNLKELKPFVKHGALVKDACVYLTTDKALAALYIWDSPFYWFTYGFTSEGIVEYIEYFPESLSYFYENRSGSIYSAEGDFEYAAQTGIKSLAVSRKSVHVKCEEFIPDAYNYILKLEKAGKIKIRRFHELSEKMLEFIRETVKAESEKHDCTEEQKIFFQEKFPWI